MKTINQNGNYLPYTKNPTPPKGYGLNYTDFQELAIVDALILFCKFIFFTILGIISRYRTYAIIVVAFLVGSGSLRYSYEKFLNPDDPYSMAIALDEQNEEQSTVTVDEHPPQAEVKEVKSKSFNPPTIINNQSTTLKFIAKWAETARQEQERFGIPASITLAQGIIESASGTSGLASDKRINNHFGIKCFAKKHKRCCVKSYDNSNGDGFRMYETAWASWRDHSKLLKNKRFKHCWDKKSIKDMAWALQEAGYAHPKKGYADKLLNVIETYNLTRFDK